MISLLALLSCAEAPPMSEAFHQVDLSVTDADAVSAAFVAAIDGAEEHVQALIPTLTDEAIAAALVEAHERGVLVEVATDVDVAADPGFATLEAAGVPVTYGDGAVSYFDFAINADVAWTSDQVVMTHAMIIADEIDVLSASGLPTTASPSRSPIRAGCTPPRPIRSWSCGWVRRSGSSSGSSTTPTAPAPTSG
jgi:hypothetical protein